MGTLNYYMQREQDAVQALQAVRDDPMFKALSAGTTAAVRSFLKGDEEEGAESDGDSSEGGGG